MIYDEARLRHEQRMFAATEAYAIHHRRLLGVTLALPCVVAFVVLAVLGPLFGLDALAMASIILASAGLAVLAYAVGRLLLRQRVARRFGVLDLDARTRKK